MLRMCYLKKKYVSERVVLMVLPSLVCEPHKGIAYSCLASCFFSSSSVSICRMND